VKETNPSECFKVYVPARLESTRLPGKVLLTWKGKTILQHVYEKAVASGAKEVVVATDSLQIEQVARDFGAIVELTKKGIESGTDRVAVAASKRGEDPDTIIVNLQGDEPLMPSAVISQVAKAASDAAQNCDIATVCESLERHQLTDPNVVKLTRDVLQRALYFSRAPIPWPREGFDGKRFEESAGFDVSIFRKHVGLYAYRKSYLDKFVKMGRGLLEKVEMLEQLRALENGSVIKCVDACSECGFGIDTQTDLNRLRDDNFS
jgi:3-deoxy-manno-octulosonate cytidylyltransferase (CMP-KDO synthetase)